MGGDNLVKIRIPKSMREEFWKNISFLRTKLPGKSDDDIVDYCVRRCLENLKAS